MFIRFLSVFFELSVNKVRHFKLACNKTKNYKHHMLILVNINYKNKHY